MLLAACLSSPPAAPPLLAAPSSRCPPARPRARSEEVSQFALNRLRGVDNHDRVDEQLYCDFETDVARGKRLAKEAKELEKLEKQSAKASRESCGASGIEGQQQQAATRRAVGQQAVAGGAAGWARAPAGDPGRMQGIQGAGGRPPQHQPAAASTPPTDRARRRARAPHRWRSTAGSWQCGSAQRRPAALRKHSSE